MVRALVGGLSNDRQALQDLEADEELDDFNRLVSRFNLFEAIGRTRLEWVHSNVLRFLFDPNETHGLGSRFLRRFLEHALVVIPEGEPLKNRVNPATLSLKGVNVS